VVKLCQETSGKLTQFLPIALLRIRNAPKAKNHLSPFEMLYGRLFLSNYLVTDPGTDGLLKYIMDLGTFQQEILKLEDKVLPAPTKGERLQIEPGEQVLIKSWKERAPADQLQPKWKDPYAVILATPMAVNVQRTDGWIHLCSLKHAAEESTSDQAQPRGTYSCEPKEELKLFFQRNPKTSTSMISKNFNIYYSTMFVPTPAPFPKYHHSAYCRALGHFSWAFCLIFLLGLTSGFDHFLEDSSNHTCLLTTPSLIPQLLIKTEIILDNTLSKWTNQNNGFIYMLSIDLSFCGGPWGIFSLFKTSFSQCLYPKWTDTYALVHSAHNKG
jgi:hypothetical protein